MYESQELLVYTDPVKDRKVLTLLLAVFGIALFVFAGARPPLLPEDSEAVIRITRFGFEPRGVAITQGEAITFVNEDTFAHWPAAHLHPTHTLYPGSDIRKCGTPEEPYLFDTCRSLEPGERFTFVFHEAGEWGFHDHLVPQYTGAVYVSAVQGYVPPEPGWAERSVLKTWTFIDRVFNLTKQSSPRGINLVHAAGAPKPSTLLGAFSDAELTSSKNYEKENLLVLAYDGLEARRAVKALGVRRVMEKLVESSKEGSTSQCHTEAHYVGYAAYDLLKEKAFADCTENCHSGCYHGAVEALFWDVGPSKVIEKTFEICSRLPSDFERFQCFHGTGHGFLALESYNLPQAIERCNEFSTPEIISSCYGGVFMENIGAGLGLSPSNVGHVTEWLSWSDPLFPCNQFDNNPTAQERCYEMQTSWMLVISNRDYDFAVSECLKAREEMIPICFRSFGRDATGNSLRDPIETKKLCDKVPEPYYSSCVFGSVSTIINFWGSGIGSRASDFCEIFERKDAQDACYGRLIERVPFIFTERTEGEAVCSTIEVEPYRTRCFEAANSIGSL